MKGSRSILALQCLDLQLIGQKGEPMAGHAVEETLRNRWPIPAARDRPLAKLCSRSEIDPKMLEAMWALGECGLGWTVRRIRGEARPSW